MTVDVIPLVTMTPRQAAAVQAMGRRFTADEMVTLAGAWLGARWYSPSLCELAASGWDEPAVATLWENAFAEIGVVVPPVDDAERLLAAQAAPAAPVVPRVRRPRRRVAPRHVPVRRR